ncbi:TGS domain-containing protein [Nostoc sp.]
MTMLTTGATPKDIAQAIAKSLKFKFIAVGRQHQQPHCTQIPNFARN